jgi:hypothetical protein
MVHVLYIVGMVFFAFLIGDSAHRLNELYEAGTLFAPYSSESKAAVTLLALASCCLAALCFLELLRIRRHFRPPVGIPFGKEPGRASTEEAAVSTNIYSAPSTVDEWEDRLPYLGTKSRRPSWYEITGLWMSLLRIYCGVLPVVYTYTLINYLFLWLPSGAGSLVLTVVFPVLLLGSVLTSVGILRRKGWGVKVGYAVAIFHLLLFPLGTAAGFVMLIALLGCTSEFEVVRRRRVNRRIRRKVKRRIKRRKLQSATL